MYLHEIYQQQKKPVISFEVFPPKTQEGIEALLKEVALLKKYRPGFISVTYGAGGSTQGRSLQVLERIIKEINLTVVPHLTCIGSSPQSILKFLNIVEGWGVKNILALRGDHPKDPEYRPESDFFKHADDLIKFVKENTDLGVGVAGFPEVHPEAAGLTQDLKYLKIKVEQGAEAVLTQLFFDNNNYYKYLESARKFGINVPIIPGIWTLSSEHQIKKINECGARIAPALFKKFTDPKYTEEDKKKIGIDHAVKQIQDLLAHGVPGLHLYTLNKAEYVGRVLDKIL